jgi:Tol biopolymer transport system component/putative cell wall-binding protein
MARPRAVATVTDGQMDNGGMRMGTDEGFSPRQGAGTSLRILLAMAVVLPLLVASPPAPASGQGVDDTTARNLSDLAGVSAFSALAVSGDDVFVTWAEQAASPLGAFSGDARAIVVARSRDRGGSFMRPRAVAPGYEGTRPAIAVSDDSVHVAFEATGHQGDRRVVLSSSHDRGWTFQTQELAIAQGGVHPLEGRVQVFAAGDDLAVVWSDFRGRWFTARSADRGASFAELALGEGQMGGAAMGGGAIHVAGTRPGPSGAPPEIVVVSAAWGVPEPVTVVLRPEAALSGPPALAAEGRTVHVLWTEVATEERPGGLLLATSRDGGVTFGPARDLTGDAWIAPPHPACEAHPTWCGRNSGRGAARIAASGGKVWVSSRFQTWGEGWAEQVEEAVWVSTDNAATFGPPTEAPFGHWVTPEADPAARASFDYTVPDRFGDLDDHGLVRYHTEKSDWHPTDLPVDLDGCSSTADAPITEYRWTISGEDPIVVPAPDCRLRHTFSEQGSHDVSLEVVDADGGSDEVTRDVVVRNLFIVSVGDSVASGEGVPDIPAARRWSDPWADDARWQDRRCHRSALAGPARAALRLEQADPRTSVSFLHLACSGASITGQDLDRPGAPPDPTLGGLLTHYTGIVDKDAPLLPPQLDVLRQAMVDHAGEQRIPDALLVSVGANDLQFSKVIIDCLLPLVRCNDNTATRKRVARLEDQLPARYALLAKAIKDLGIPEERVFLTEYPDAVHDDDGQPDLSCVTVPPLSNYTRIDPQEVEWAKPAVFERLDQMVAKASETHHWNHVPGGVPAFRTHGYCARDSWFVTLAASVWSQGDQNGGFHPNVTGHDWYGQRIAEAVAPTVGLGVAVPPPSPTMADADVYLMDATDAGLGLRPVAGVDGLAGLGDRVSIPHPAGATSGGFPHADARGTTAVDGSAVLATWGFLQPPVPPFNPEIAFTRQPAGPPDLRLDSIDVVQAAEGAGVAVAGKPAVVLARVTNDFPTTVWAFVRLHATADRGDRTETRAVALTPGHNEVWLHGEPDIVPAEDTSELVVTVELDPHDVLEEHDESNNALTGAVPVTRTGEQRVLYLPLEVPGQHPVCRDVESVARRGGAYLVGAFPLAAERTEHRASCSGSLRTPEGTLDEEDLARVLRGVATSARLFGYDHGVGVAPAGWFADRTVIPAALALGLQGPADVDAPPAAGAIVMAGAPDTAVAHEVAHNLGLEHVDGGGAARGYWVTAPDGRRRDGQDLMAVTGDPRNWVSAATYQRLLARLASPSVGTFAAAAADGSILVSGLVDGEGEVEAGPWYRGGEPGDVGLGATGELTLEYTAEDGTVLATTGLELHEAVHQGVGGTAGPARAFVVRVPDLPGAATLVVRRDGVELLERTVSASAPQVAVTAPVGGEEVSVGDVVEVAWDASDADGDELVAAVAVSTDEGASWRPVAIEVPGDTLRLTATRDLAGATVRVRVSVSDGVDVAHAESAPFTVRRPGAIPPARTNLVYSDRDAGGLWVTDPDGRLRSRLTDIFPGDPDHAENANDELDIDPAVSPDGMTIAFASRRGGRRQPRLWLMDADGTNARPLTTPDGFFAAFDVQPSWSPDGERIAFVRRPESSSRLDIHIVNRDGTGLTGPLTTPMSGSLGQPTWSPDGESIAFYDWELYHGAIVVMDADGTDHRAVACSYDPCGWTGRVGTVRGSPTWSPDGSRIGYIRETATFRPDIWSVAADGSDDRAITTDGRVESGLAWSPDGSAFAHMGAGGLVVSPAEGGPPRVLVPWLNRFASFAWSPAPVPHPGDDGGAGRLVYARIADNNNELHTARTDGTGVTRLTSTLDHELEPDWSPDGREIVFRRVSPSGAQQGLFVMAADGSGERLLRSSGDWPAWSPDGVRIAFSELVDQRHKDLWIVDADGSDAQRVRASNRDLSDEHYRTPVWSSDGRRLAYLRGAGSRYVVEVLDLGEGTTTQVTDPDVVQPNILHGLGWSPDDAEVVFEGHGPPAAPGFGSIPDVWAVDVVTGTPRRLHRIGTGHAPDWSAPDGRLLYGGHAQGGDNALPFTLQRGDGRLPTQLVNVTGTHARWVAAEDDEAVEDPPRPPADAGGPYDALEGTPFRLDASGSAPREGVVPLYEWDLDGDGAFDDAHGLAPEVVLGQDGTHTVALRVTDDSGAEAVGQAQVRVGDVAPVVHPMAGDVARPGAPISLGVAFTDPGDDVHTATVDWGDGSGPQDVEVTPAGAGGSAGATHGYDDAGSYQVTWTICDDAGECGTTTGSVSVTLLSATAVTGVEPRSGPAAGGTEVSVSGRLLGQAQTVLFGDVPAPDFEVRSDRWLVATAPALPAGETVDVRVVTAGGTSAASAVGTYTAENLDPVGVDQQLAVRADQRTTVTLSGSDPEGDPVAMQVVRGPREGTVELEGTALTYTPRVGWAERDAVLFAVTDPRGGVGYAMVTMDVGSRHPVAREDRVQRDGNGPVRIPFATLTANDRDPDGDDLVLARVMPLPGTRGELDVTDDAVTYRPIGGDDGVDAFAYELLDATGMAALGEVYVVPTPPSSGPPPSTNPPGSPPTEPSRSSGPPPSPNAPGSPPTDPSRSSGPPPSPNAPGSPPTDASAAPGPPSSPSPSPSLSPSPAPAPQPRPTPSPSPGSIPVERIAGPTRVETAVEISRAVFAPDVDVALVATQDDFPDALSAGPAAGAMRGPVLLVGRDALPDATADELRRLRPRRIVLLGGHAAISPEVEDALRHLTGAALARREEPPDGGIVRYQGATRYETAAALAQAMLPEPGGTVVLASGEVFPDALAGGVVAARAGGPVLLTRQDALPASTAAELERRRPTEVVIVGGVAAVSAAVADEVAHRTGAPVRRLSGADRYATAVAVARSDLAGARNLVYVASGERFPDALTAVPAATIADAPILLTGSSTAPEVLLEYLRDHRPRRVRIVGGPSAVADDVADQLGNP